MQGVTLNMPCRSCLVALCRLSPKCLDRLVVLEANLDIGKLLEQVPDRSPEHDGEASLILSDQVLPMFAVRAHYSAQPTQHQSVLLQQHSLQSRIMCLPLPFTNKRIQMRISKPLLRCLQPF